MIEELKKIFTLNNILCCFISAIGYGIGYAIPEYYGYGFIICLISCLIIGTIIYYVASIILSSKFFNEHKKRKYVFALIIYVIYFVVCYETLQITGHDMDYDFFLNLGFLIVFQILSFVIRYIRAKISKKG